MKLAELKLAAKRFRKQKHLFDTTGPVSQTQALEVLSRIHGFKHYHEAKTRLTGTDLLAEMCAEPGGLLSHSFAVSNLGSAMVPRGSGLAIVGRSGRGKTCIASELICQALVGGRPVRIIDSGSSYSRLVHLLQGLTFDEPIGQAYLQAWRSNSSLVLLNFQYDSARTFNGFADLMELPENALVVCDEVFQFSQFQVLRADCVLTAMHEEDLPTAPEEMLMADDDAPRTWTWRRKNGTYIDVQMFMTPLRYALYSTQRAYHGQLGLHPSRQQLDEFVTRMTKQNLG